MKVLVFCVLQPGGSYGKESACNAGEAGSIPGSGRPLEKEMATYSSIPDWKISLTEKPGRLYGPWGHKVVDTTERLTLSLSIWKFYYFATLL